MGKYLIIFIIFLNGCNFFTDYRTITVSLPYNSAPWFQDDSIGKVFYPGTSGSVESSVIEWSRDFNIEIEKGSSVPITCYPSGYLKPAGAILPMDLKNMDKLQLSWNQGFLAELLLQLIEKGIRIEGINIPRLMDEINTESQGDPWSIDKEKLSDAIIYNSLSIYKIKKENFQIITIPITGTWISDNPFFPVSVSNVQNELIIEDIYRGLHRFKNPVTNQHLDLLVKDESFEYLVY
jgi:hypothetical protein